MKTVFRFWVALMLVGFMAGNVMATDCTDSFTECDAIPDTAGTGGPGISDLKLSPNVQLAYSGAANAYTLGTWNSAGTRAYGANSGETGIYVSKEEVRAADGVSLPAASEAFASDSWTVLGK